MKILHATLEKKWFNMILAGIKKEEYRDIKPYWIKRLLNSDFTDDRKFVFADNERHYDAIQFTNGYGKKAPTMLVEYRGVKVGNTKEGWAAIYKTEVFVLSLGKILETKNIKQVMTTGFVYADSKKSAGGKTELPDATTLEILKAELGERRFSRLNKNGLTLLVQWAMVKYHDAQKTKFEIGQMYTLQKDNYEKFCQWVHDEKLCSEHQTIMSNPVTWQCRAYYHRSDERRLQQKDNIDKVAASTLQVGDSVVAGEYTHHNLTANKAYKIYRISENSIYVKNDNGSIRPYNKSNFLLWM